MRLNESFKPAGRSACMRMKRHNPAPSMKLSLENETGLDIIFEGGSGWGSMTGNLGWIWNRW